MEQQDGYCSHILCRSVNKKGKVLGHLPRLDSSNAGSLKLLSEVK